MPLLWISGAFLLGLFLAAWQPLAWEYWAAAAGFCLALGLAEGILSKRLSFLHFWRRFAPLPAGILLAVMLAGAARYQAAQPLWTPADLAWYNNQGWMRITARVIAPPDRRDQAVLLRMRAVELWPPQDDAPKPASGLLLARLAGGDWHYGDLVELKGRPVTAPAEEDFSYRDYLARQGIHTYLPYPAARLLRRATGNPLLAAIYELRQRAYQTLIHAFPQPESSLLAGILLGIESDIPAAMKRAFQDTGTSHIIAISGFNIAILAGLFAGFSNRLLPQPWAFLATLLGIAGYTLLVGAQASVVRAAIMGGLGLLGQQIGRRQSGVNTLAFTAAVMSLFNPLLPWDVGFQLSFAATLGLILFAGPLQAAFIRLAERRLSSQAARRLSAPVGEYLLFTLAAQVTTLPIILYHFQRLSLSSLLANPLILPPQPLVMILGGIAVLVGLVIPPLGQMLAYLTWPLLAYTIRMVDLLAALPQGVIAIGRVSLAGVLAFYVLLFGFFFFKQRLAGLLRRLTPALALTALGLLTAFLWRGVLASPDGRLHLTLLNVQGGPAFLLQAPGGQTLLIGGGARATQLSDAVGRRLPPLTRRLDWLIVPADDAAAFSGLPATLERFPAGAVLWNEKARDSSSRRKLLAHLSGAGLLPQPLAAGQRIDLGQGAEIRVLAVTSQGAALLVEHERFRALLPGGVAPARIRAAAGEPIAGISFLALDEDETSAEALLAWAELQPLVLAAPAIEPAGAGPVNFIDLRRSAWVAVSSDGRRLWVEAGE